MSLRSDQKGLGDVIPPTLEEHNLNQLQRIPTRLDAILDLYCTNKPGLLKSINTVPGFSDHDLIVVDIMIKAM